MSKEIKQIDAVHEKDLFTLLTQMGVVDDFQDGKLKCKFCREIVTNENIHSVLPQSGEFNLICDKPECVFALTEYLYERKLRRTQD